MSTDYHALARVVVNRAYKCFHSRVYGSGVLKCWTHRPIPPSDSSLASSIDGAILIKFPANAFCRLRTWRRYLDDGKLVNLGKFLKVQSIAHKLRVISGHWSKFYTKSWKQIAPKSHWVRELISPIVYLLDACRPLLGLGNLDWRGQRKALANQKECLLIHSFPLSRILINIL